MQFSMYGNDGRLSPVVAFMFDDERVSIFSQLNTHTHTAILARKEEKTTNRKIKFIVTTMRKYGENESFFLQNDWTELTENLQKASEAP